MAANIHYPFSCEICGKNFTGISSFNQHINSDNHFSKVFDLMKSDNVKVSLSVNRLSDDDNFQSMLLRESEGSSSFESKITLRNAKVNDIKFDLCSSSFNNETPVQDQLDSKKCESKIALGQPVQVDDLKCDVCSMSFNNCIPYQDHLNSKKHQSKVARLLPQPTSVLHAPSAQEQNLSIDFTSDSVNLSLKNSTPERSIPSHSTSGFSCNACKKSFTGQEPFQQHLDSKKHKAKISSCHGNNQNCAGDTKHIFIDLKTVAIENSNDCNSEIQSLTERINNSKIGRNPTRKTIQISHHESVKDKWFGK